jgi:signal transduction histidine kinase
LNCKKKSFRQRFGLPLFFSAVVFAILLITSLIIVMAGVLLIQINALNIAKLSRREPLVRCLCCSSSACLVGTVVSFVISRFPLKPMRRIIDATNRLAAGDFSVRLKLPGPSALTEVATSFNRMAEELGGIEMLRTDFVDNFSHEFKTPIVSIKGFAEELRHDDLTPEQRSEYLDIIISESSRLSMLATNVLDLSRVEKQTILTNPARFDLTEQVRRSALLFETKWEQRRLNLTVELDEISLVGDEDLLSQVWLNLIDNAVKFTPEGAAWRFVCSGTVTPPASPSATTATASPRRRRSTSSTSFTRATPRMPPRQRLGSLHRQTNRNAAQRHDRLHERGGCGDDVCRDSAAFVTQP